MINKDCIKCGLHKGSSNVCIGGIGNDKATLMIINEYPSVEDDKFRTVLGGGAKIVHDVLKEVLNIDPSITYMTNLVKCRGNGTRPVAKEVEACMEYLIKEIELVQPRAIITLGELGLNFLCDKVGITMHRGNVFKFNGIPVVPTFSPAYLKYNSKALTDFAGDFEKAILCSMGMVKDKDQGTKVVYCKEVEDVFKLIEYIKETGVICFDFETNGIDTYSSPEFKVKIIAVSFQHGSSYIIPWEHEESWFNEEQRSIILKALNDRIFQNPDIKKVNQNIKFEFHVLNHLGIPEIKGQISDTMLQHHLLNENLSHSLEVQVSQVFKEYAGYKESMKGKWATAGLEQLSEYAGKDTDLTLRLENHYEALLFRDEKRYRLYRNLVIPALRTLYRMERNGALIDRDFLNKAIEDTTKAAEKQLEKLRNFKQVKRFERAEEQKVKDALIAELEAKCEKQKERRLNQKKINLNDSAHEKRWKDNIAQIKSGIVNPYEGINFGSPQQLSALLYSKEGFNFKKIYDYKSGEEGGTAKPVLLELKDSTGFIEELLVYRSVQKMLSTYLVGIRDRLDKNDKIHTSYMQHGTVTGRLSSQNPNLQNIPRGAKLDHPVAIEVVGKIKKTFIPPKDHYMVQVDYSQAELRLAAFFANEPTMLKVYSEGGDLHVTTAAGLLGISVEEFFLLPEDKRKEARSKAKAGNFGMIYDISAEGFVRYAKDNYKLVLSLSEAKKMIDIFFNTYPMLKIWHENYKMRAERDGFVTTLFGRRRHVSDIYSGDNFLRGQAEREAINSPVQGTAGEFTIFALVLLEHRLSPKIMLSNTVHDSIVFYIPYDLMEYAVPLIRETCENLPILEYFGVELKGVKMKVDIEYSKDNWKDLKPYEE